MKGIVAFYIDIHPEFDQAIQQVMDIVLKANHSAIDKISKESEYQVMFIPTTKEACRAEKIDFDKPYPRVVAVGHLDVESIEKRKAAKEKDRETQREREREIERLRHEKGVVQQEKELMKERLDKELLEEKDV